MIRYKTINKKNKFIIKIITSILIILLPIQLLISYYPRININIIFGSYFPLPPLNLLLDGYIMGLLTLWISKPISLKAPIEDKIDIFKEIHSNPNLKEIYDKLLNVYKKKYPHNPEGVLKYHINREFKKENNLEMILNKLLMKNIFEFDEKR